VTNADDLPPVTITKWGKGREGALMPKTPSIIAYAEDNEKQKEEIVFGSNVPSESCSYVWFKLLLDDETNPADYEDPLMEQVIGSHIMGLPAGKTAAQLVTDYLSQIHKHIFTHLRGVLDDGLDITPLVFCVTVPAAYGRAGRQATLSAAKAAGFGTRDGDELICCDEPQCAILDVLHTYMNKFQKVQSPFREKECVLNVDMG
jgi:molecular chaperone DnaK (HSP70)